VRQQRLDVVRDAGAAEGAGVGEEVGVDRDVHCVIRNAYDETRPETAEPPADDELRITHDRWTIEVLPILDYGREA